ncbi:MAG: NAD(P)-dependent glycerol-3-phosphate dehydrogenase [Chloroflexi bacterium]|nr:NAD(P)-dependent glycerol-3-phosphate dehydrogenase [Chloroflexota bacterium]
MTTDAISQGQVAVIGTGTWGTTLAVILARRGIEVRLLARTPGEAQALIGSGENPRLPGVAFPESLTVTDDWGNSLDDAAAVLFVVPSRTLRENARRVRPYLGRGPLVICATKGIEEGTGKPMLQCLAEELPEVAARLACLSGPNLAREVVRGLPTSTVVASANEGTAREAQLLLNSTTFRVYTNSDVVGVELGGALKNIIVIGAGVIDGLGFGDNAKAAFLTRGLAEITRLGVAAGAQPMTFMGNAGLGDLMATAISGLSRNHRVGIALAEGKSLQQAIDGLGGEVAEGVTTAAAAMEMARAYGVEMPITELTCRVLFEGLSARDALAELMEREPKPE